MKLQLPILIFALTACNEGARFDAGSHVFGKGAAAAEETPPSENPADKKPDETNPDEPGTPKDDPNTPEDESKKPVGESVEDPMPPEGNEGEDPTNPTASPTCTGTDCGDYEPTPVNTTTTPAQSGGSGVHQSK